MPSRVMDLCVSVGNSPYGGFSGDNSEMCAILAGMHITNFSERIEVAV